MSYDDDNLPPPPRAGAPTSGRKPLGKLAQSARGAELKKARGILLAMGILTIALNAIQFPGIGSQVDKLIQNEQQKGVVIAPEARDTLIAIARIFLGGFITLGVIFVLFGLIVQKFPVPITIAAMVIYLGANAVLAVFNFESIFAGIPLKIITVVALVQAIQSAVAYQKGLREGSYS